MSDLLKNWIDESSENARLLCQEDLILDVTERVLECMEKKKISKSDLATALGKTKPYVTQLLNGSRNMTLRTLADIAFALDTKAKVHFSHKLPHGAWEEDVGFTCVRAPRRFFALPDDTEHREEIWHDIPLQQVA